MNDWIIANINNPSFDISDFKNIADMTNENTQLLPYEEYLHNEKIRNHEMFKDNQGNFNEDKLKAFYYNKAKEFLEFHEDTAIDNYQYSMWDTRRTKDSEIKNPNFHFIKAGHPDDTGFSIEGGLPVLTVFNPDRNAIGVEGVNIKSDKIKGVSELAQSSNIFDTEKGEFLDETVNDKALFGNKSLFTNVYNYISSLGDDPLVIAKYEEDEYDAYGNIIHKKGEYKYNEEGTYYTETLNNRSPIGKEFVSALDYITIDGTTANRYDFFDADSIDKSAGGTVMKNLAAVAPMIFLGSYAPIYAGVFVVREMAKALPMLADIVTLFGDNQNIPLLNTIAGYGHKFTGSTSEYSKNNLFTFENVGNLISDVALQWGQQKAIANTMAKLSGGSLKTLDIAAKKAELLYREKAKSTIVDGLLGKIAIEDAFKYIGTNKIDDIGRMITDGSWRNTPLGTAAVKKYVDPAMDVVRNRQRIGLDLALGYMAIVSNTDVYQDVISRGGTQKEAAAIALGSTIGMFTVDKMLGLGELFYDDATAETRKAFRTATRKEASDIYEGLKKTGTVITSGDEKKGLMKFIKGGFLSGINAVKNYQGAVKDHSIGFWGKALGEGLEETSEELVTDIMKSFGEIAGDFGYFSQNDYGAWENMAARYGMSFFGGALGGGLFYGVDAILKYGSSTAEKEAEQSLIYLLRNHKKDEVLKTLKKDYDRGYEFGSKTLSVEQDKDGNFLTANKDRKSQNDYVYEKLVETIHLIDEIIKQNQMDLSEDLLFDRMVMSEARYLALKDYLQDASYATGYQQEYNNLIKEIKDLTIARKALDKDHPTGSEASKISEIDKQLKLAQERRDNFLSGKYSLYYMEKLNFLIDTGLSAPFITMNFNQWVRNNYGKDVLDLRLSELETVKSQYDAYKKLYEKEDATKAFDLYKGMLQLLMPTIESLNEVEVTAWHKIAQQLEKQDPWKKLKSFNDKLDDESPEDFENRDKMLEGETEEAFAARKQDRLEKIKQYNELNLLKEYETFIKGLGFIDSHSFRVLIGKLAKRKQDLKNMYIESVFNLFFEDVDPTYDFDRDNKIKLEIADLLKNLKYDGSNKKEIKETIKKLLETNYRNHFNNLYEDQIFYNELLYNIELNLQDLGYELPKTYLLLFDIFDDLTLKNYDINELLNDTDVFIAPMNTDAIQYFIEEYQKYKNSDKKNAILEQIALGLITPEEGEQLISELPDSTLDINGTIGKSLKEVNDLAKDYLDTQGQMIITAIENEIIDGIITDPWINTFNDFESKLRTDHNPVLQLIRQVKPTLGGSKDLESLLQEIFDIWNNVENVNDFELSDSQIKSLEETIKLLDYARAFIYGASSISTYALPIGHNKAINEYVSKHSDVFENTDPLPELKEEVGNVFIYEIQRYQHEAKWWINKALGNRINKALKLKNTDKAIINSRILFYKANSDLILSDGTNLLEGVENLGAEESLKNLVDHDNLLYLNFLKALAKGWKREDLLEEIYKKVTKIDNIELLIVSSLNENLKYSEYSDYDKFQLVTSVLAVSDTDFYTKLKKFIESSPKTKDGDNIIPLTTLEYALRIIDASLLNPEFINSALEVVLKNSRLKLPILYNTSVVTGKGGAGKTQVVVKGSVSDIDNKDIWVSGPTENLINGLLEVLSGSKGVTFEELFKTITPEYESLMAQLSKGSIDNDYKFAKLRGIAEYPNKPVEILDKFPIITTQKDKPKVIVIDEATWVPNAVLLVLGRWAKQTGVKVILVGDELQGGFSGPGSNLNREHTLAWRTPRLDISLRDANLQKAKNLQMVENLMDELRTSTTITSDRIKQLYLKDIPGLNFKYFLGEGELNGELIVKDLNDELISSIKGKIGYVGSTEDALYKELKDKGLDIQAFSEKGIQGKEFDYTIINTKWEVPKILENEGPGYTFLQKLYTMMSRSRQGTIFIDNGLSSIITNSRESIHAIAPSLKSAATEFSKHKNNELNSLDLTPLKSVEEVKEDPEEKEEEKKEEKKEEPKKDLKEELEKNKKELEEESKKRQTNIIADFIDAKYPIRMYGNVHLLGVESYEEDDKNVWENVNDSKQDVGIFLQPGKKVTDGEEKDDLVQKVLYMKSYLSYMDESKWERMPIDIKSKFNKESFKNAKYYIQVKDTDHLIGQTNLDSNKLAMFDKIFSIIAKIKDKDGIEHAITMGTLANPNTWRAGESEILEAVREKLKDNPNEDLLRYVDNFSTIVDTYENNLKELAKKNLERPIKKPNFTGMSELIFKDSEGNKLERRRLIDPDSKKTPWKSDNKYAITSRVHLVTKEVPGTKLKTGTTVVRYGTSNMLLRPDELEEIYWRQRRDGEIPQVRMEVLTKEGVSFRSLFSKDYKDLYNLKIGENTFTFPVDLEPTAVRMYFAMWNFRANVKKFLEALQQWQSNESITDVDKVAKLDNDLYEQYRKEKGSYGTEKEYRTWALDKASDVVKKLWEFNDSLANSVRQFRLGHSGNGAYVRRLTNINPEDNNFYKGIEDPTGIYITLNMAELYEKVLDKMFEVFLNEIIPAPEKNAKTYIAVNKEDGWFKKLSTPKGREITLNITSFDNGEVKTLPIPVPPTETLKALPVLLTEMAKYLNYASNWEAFNSAYSKENSKFRLKIKDGDKEKEIPYLQIGEAWDGGLWKSFESNDPIPGVREFTDDKDITTLMDFRMNDLWDLMFHGFIVKKNDFINGPKYRATDAYYKYGIEVDPIMYKPGNSLELGVVATNEALFSSDVNYGFPIAYVDLEEYIEAEEEAIPPMNREEATSLINGGLIDEYASESSWGYIASKNPTNMEMLGRIGGDLLTSNLIRIIEMASALDVIPSLITFNKIKGMESLSIDEYTKVVTDLIEKGFTNPKLLLNHLKTVLTNDATLNDLKLKVNLILPEELKLNDVRLAKINELSTLINLVNKLLKNNYELFFKSNKNMDFKELIEHIEVKDGEVIVHKFSDRPDFPKENIISQSWVKGSLVIKLEDGNIVRIQYIKRDGENKVVISEKQANSEMKETMTADQVKAELLNVRNWEYEDIDFNNLFQIDGELDEVLLKEYENTINRLFSQTIGDKVIAEKAALKIFNELQKFFEEDDDVDYMKALNKYRDILTNLKQKSCIIG